MHSLQTCFIFVAVVIVSVNSVSPAEETAVKREEDVEEGSDPEASESRAVNKDKRLGKRPPTITIPIRNAVVQALAPIERHAAEAASHKPSRDSFDEPASFGGGVVGDIVYEDELPADLEGWIPPPPPPPETLFRRPSYHSPHHHQPSSTFTRLASMRPHLSANRLFGDDFALFLVILTIAGFFGLMLAMFMPFTFLMNQQPVGIGGISPYPYGQVSSVTPSSVYGYPYGRRRRSADDETHSDWNSGSLDFFFQLLMQAIIKYDDSNNRNKVSLSTGSHAFEPPLRQLTTIPPSASSTSATFSASPPFRITSQTS